MAAPNATKGARYLGLLDQALCNGNWSEVPELARKVDKHAPDRRALTAAARAEGQIASASHRPTSAASSTATSLHALGELVPQLHDVASSEQGRKYPDDAFIATVTAAKIYWLQEDAPSALGALAGASVTSYVPSSRSSAEGTPTLGWLEVAQVTASLIRADSLDLTARAPEAREAYRAAVVPTPGSRTPELRRWTERLLARACLHNVKKMPTSLVEDLDGTYSAFRTWGEFWQRAPPPQTGKVDISRLDLSRRQIWKAYYEVLSTILRKDMLVDATAARQKGALLPPDALLSAGQRTAARQAQYTEFKRVQSTYESLLLSETQFPKSSKHNAEVEEWVDQVMANWRTLSGKTWSALDFPEGGRNGVARVVLDILYRAATKTFHSTPILRHLFTVHAALGEYDLSIHAFDSYAEIMDRGKARAEKTSEHEVGLDDDEIAVATAAEAVQILCGLGDQEQIEKAVKVGAKISTWLDHQPLDTAREDVETDQVREDATPRPQSHLQPSTLATALRAVALTQATSARLTFEQGERSRLLAEASKNLQEAYKLYPQGVETAHALALVLAETRDVSGAIRVIKTALAADDAGSGLSSTSATSRETQLVPLWHLLALCLTARDEHEAAMQMCDAAF